MDETTIVITPTIEIIIISKVVVISIVVAKVHNSFIEQKYFFHVVVQYITAISVRSGHIFANVYKTMQTNRHTNVFIYQGLYFVVEGSSIKWDCIQYMYLYF